MKFIGSGSSIELNCCYTKVIFETKKKQDLAKKIGCKGKDTL